MTHGLVWGKFLPLHAGHSALISAAVARCSRVTVALGARPEEPIPRDVREAWIRELHPTVEVAAHWDHEVIDYDDPHVWDLHMAQLASVVHDPVDVVFTSEDYGDELAARLGAEHVCLDLSRTTLPVSGTAVRADPGAFWWALSPPVRAWYCKRVVVLGAESTGTTTLSADLAEALGTTWVPEYGREWTSVRPGGLSAPWVSAEFDHVAERQNALEDDAARTAPVPWLVCDTDALATAVWHERYVGMRSASVEALVRVPSFYVLTGDEIPWVDDGMRDGEGDVRAWMTGRFREVLEAQAAPWVEVSGSRESRVEQARRVLETD